MGPRRAYRNPHHLGGFVQAKFVVEDQMQNFPLPPGKVGKCLLKHHLQVDFVDRLIDRVRLRAVFNYAPISQQSELFQRVTSAEISRCIPNYGEEPRLESRLAIVSGISFQHLEID